MRFKLLTFATILAILPRALNAEPQFFFEDFNDLENGEVRLWRQGAWAGAPTFVENGNLIIEDCGFDCAIGIIDPETNTWARYTDVSFRIQGRITAMEGPGRSFISPYGRSLPGSGAYFGAVNSDSEAIVGVINGSTPNRLDEMDVDFDFTATDVVMKFDLIGDEVDFAAWPADQPHSDLPLVSFRDNRLAEGTVGPAMGSFDGLASSVYRWMEVAEIVPGDVDTNDVIDVRDIDYLSSAIRNELDRNRYDVDRDGSVNSSDHETLVNGILNTWYGDANLDGEFNTGDFTTVFQAGEFEDRLAGNSTWGTGDWNGDGEFNTGDFITAFQQGGFERGPRPRVASVPEPTTPFALVIGLLYLRVRQRNMRDRTVAILPQGKPVR